MNRYVCIHGHFYQPPRENPWLNDVELQPSAYPFHDWNERITAECYEPNAESRILDHEGRVKDIINNYSRISFNFGPTLLDWMEKKTPELYHAILKADRMSMERFSSHGSALAQVYNHMIMPLANERDKHTQVIWGIRDFEHRFQRKPEGMWLSETAVDIPTLEVLAAHDIKFTILSPYQAKRVRRKDGEWQDASGGKIDPKNSYLLNLPSGKQIYLFFYDGHISKAVAFEKLLNDGEHFANRLLEGIDHESESPQLMNIGTDGETYGHHHNHGEMALSYALDCIDKHERANLSIYAEFLERFPTEYEVEIQENTSWSCAHGIERWRSDCGCRSLHDEGWNQQWRGPLRAAFDHVRDVLVPMYEEEMKKFVADPWSTRNDYIKVILDRSKENVNDFIVEQTGKELSTAECMRFLKLLEMQYHAMLMYTSCGWFFDEVTGIETVQDICYAARAIQLGTEITGADYETEFVRLLEKAPSNHPDLAHAANAYWKYVKPTALDLFRVGGHFAISSLFEDYPGESSIYSYTVTKNVHVKEVAGKQKLVIGHATFRSQITWEEEDLSYAIMHLGEHNLFGGVRTFQGEEAFNVMRQEIDAAFQSTNTHEVTLLIDKHFGDHSYTIDHLFKDVQQKVLDKVMENTLANVQGLFQQVYENNYQFMIAIRMLNKQIPKPIKIILDFSMNGKISKAIESEDLNLQSLDQTINEAVRFDIEFDKPLLSYVISNRVSKMAAELQRSPEDTGLLEKLETLLLEVKKLPVPLNLSKAQNVAFRIRKNLYPQLAAKDDEQAKKWADRFNRFYEALHMKL